MSIGTLSGMGNESKKRPGECIEPEPKLVHRLLEVIEHEIVPLTRVRVSRGDKIFGAALLRKSDLSTILAATNHETENPLWHGEIYAIKSYYEMVNSDASKRIDPSEQIFLSTHEPCTLCSSALAWGGYDNCYYLFSHEESRDEYAIGHDLNILKEVFGLGPGGYSRQNGYWTAYWIADLVRNCRSEVRGKFDGQLERIRTIYEELSETYQANKQIAKNIPLK